MYESCKNIFCKSFTHYVLIILVNYHKLTSASNGLQKVPKELAADGDEKNEIAVDSAILQHSLDILCILLRTTDPVSEEHKELIKVFPELLKLSL